jgi:PPOX class probable F420-dependent enzyme
MRPLAQAVKSRQHGSSRDLRLRSPQEFLAALYNVLMPPIPAEIRAQRYISLATFRKSGVAVYTPIWFAEDDTKLYFMTNSKLGKCKRIRNNPQVKIAPCTIRGKITGPEFPATVRVMRPEEFARVRRLIDAKYWLARLPFVWRNTDTYIEITPASS